MLTGDNTELADPKVVPSLATGVVPSLANRWSHHWRTGGPITLARTRSKWSHAPGGRQPVCTSGVVSGAGEPGLAG